MRVRHIKDIDEKLEKFPNLIDVKSKLDLKKVFNNDNPIHLEIGTGKAKFIKELAQNNPNINYIGCEICKSIIYKALKGSEVLSNLVFIICDAQNLNEIFESESVNQIYLNFSDPWPKSRHEKRRLTHFSFLEIFNNILIKNSLIEFKTDNRSLFEYSVINFNQIGYKFLDLSLDLHTRENIITTEYEEKFKALNQKIYYIKVRI